MTEQQQEQVLKALKDAHRFLLDVDRKSPAIPLSLVQDARRVRAEVSYALQLAGKL